MPHVSKRGPLLNMAELVRLFGKSQPTIERKLAALRKAGRPAYLEKVPQRHGKGGALVSYYDPSTLGWEVPGTCLHQILSDGDSPLSPSPVSITASSLHQLAKPAAQPTLAPARADEPANLSPSADVMVTDVWEDPAQLLLSRSGELTGGTYIDGGADVLARHRDLLPILTAPEGSTARAQAITALAQERGVSPRTIYREVDRVETRGLDGLKRHRRADAGSFRLPLETLQLIVSALISNPPTTSTNFVHRTLLRAVPEAMTFERGTGRRITVTAATVGRVKRMMMDHPSMRMLFANADQRKEFLRSYTGQVVALHANDMWQMDMTRCDVEVLNPETGRIYRPRVQAVIDVFSGCIMGIAFSESEDQTQADLVLMRSLMRKSGPLAEQYPLFGLPRRLYIDNGKTYSSAHFHRIAAGLGIDLVHSIPRVSHTRGAIERFFGTLHGLERAMPGYVGQNAADRSSEELKRLRASTERWVATGRDPGPRDRLQTIQEYQNSVLAWLIVEYHQRMVDGATRLEHFQRTAPASTLLEFDPGELLLLFARRDTRVVKPDGTVTVSNVAWTIPGGRLAQYRGLPVQVLSDQFALGDDTRVIAWHDERTGQTQLLGRAVPAPTVAASVAAGEERRAQKAVKQQVLRDADALAAEYTNPALMVTEQLRRELPVQAVTPLQPTARAALNPAPTTPDLGDFGKAFLKPADDLDALLRQINEEAE
ncbi:DDE-type integrase/transposase/recombinase [Deinococcus kurensis]|uniref:DDE-type integrase/transposase/recombinase n=1 Tax=Deinococcus kurensis TaxID=2662757 RepID=UPI0012D2B8C6|nr:DDE-type integrase/transposase/recombinase [Deinococcus kurensis]